MANDGVNFLRFKKSLAGIPFWKSTDMWQTIHPPSGCSQAKGLPKQLGFPVDGRRLSAVVKAFLDVAINPRLAQVGGTDTA
jgi:hypothetical protein